MMDNRDLGVILHFDNQNKIEPELFKILLSYVIVLKLSKISNNNWQNFGWKSQFQFELELDSALERIETVGNVVISRAQSLDEANSLASELLSGKVSYFI